MIVCFKILTSASKLVDQFISKVLEPEMTRARKCNRRKLVFFLQASENSARLTISGLCSLEIASNQTTVYLISEKSNVKVASPRLSDVPENGKQKNVINDASRVENRSGFQFSATEV